MKHLYFFLVICAAAAVLAGCAKRAPDREQVNPGEKIVIKFSHVVAEDTPKGLAALRFARLVEERTNGRVEVQVFPNSVLYKDGEELTALEENKVQLIAPTTSKLGEMFPEMQLFDLPYAFADTAQVHRATDGEIGKKLAAVMGKNNLLPLAYWDNGFKQMTSSRRRLIYPADFYGLTFRVMINSKVLEEQFRAFGAKTVQLPFNEVYQALASGAVEGQENTMSNILSQKFYEVQPYMTISNHGFMCYVVLTNAQFWNSLPGDIRKILEETMAEVTAWERKKAEELNDRDLAKIKTSGKVQIHVQTEEERKIWKKVWDPLYDRFAPVVGADLIQAVRELQQQS
ncbi:MAG: TRAP transporter substrate-binding protein [Bacillota bacterium]